jgi:hypothetical protein
MRRSFRRSASAGNSTVVLDSSALACARGGLVSNFNRLTPASDYNPDGIVQNAVEPARES